MKKLLGVAFLASACVLGSGCAADSEEEVTAEEGMGLVSPAGGATATDRVTCASQFFQRRECPVDVEGGRIIKLRILQETSTPPFACRQNDSHGFGRDFVWVERGCGAEFEVTIDLPVMSWQRLRCASNNLQYNVCASSLRDIRDIRLIRQESSHRCEQGVTFGAYEDAVWVDRGCRGIFEVRGFTNAPRQVELFDRRDFTGNRLTVAGAVRNLANEGFNDRTRSLIVRAGQWELCNDAGYSGWCRTFGPGRYNDLGPLNGEISSIRPR